ncbi:MAG: HAMP domain-containing histidine kinase [Paenibacillus sp.]|nr:HAMP domain-containing histidine kinase [Paenibacillus sp.]
MHSTRLRGILALGFAAAMLTGLFMGILASKTVSNSSYKHTVQLIGAIYSEHPELEESLIRALNPTDSGNIQAGSNLMNKYGYTQRVFFDENCWVLITYSLMVWGALFLLFAVILYSFKMKRRERIHEITNYLHSINQKQEMILPRHQEDEFSFLEDEMYKTVVELRQTRETALKERQSLKNNLTNITHQLKTPITSIFLMTELLADSRESDEDLLYVEKIHKQMNRLEYLVSAILTLSRLDSGTLEMKREPVNVYEMLTCAVEPLEKIIAQKGQALIIVQNEPAVIYSGDYYWSIEAVLNLIKNCSEHTPAGGTITLSYEQNPIFTRIVVEDNGKGLVKEEIPDLFKRFYKGKNARKDSVGIGLALAKSIIEKQNGNIRAENRREGGARFIIKLYRY